MSTDGLFIGIDTSNYTTSASVCTSGGEVLLNIKKLLDVGQGERGLRQSDALFQHNRNLPLVMDELSCFLCENHPHAVISGVGYSAYPRDCEGSYMPCFLAGQAIASAISAVSGAKMYRFSHQAGHIMAALYSSGCERLIMDKAERTGGRFAAFHVSGGTTEILLVTPERESFKIELVGGTKDINAGQAIDRAGVMMGLKFPCGAEMERLCEGADGYGRSLKLCVSGLYCNLSGLENQARELYAQTSDKGQVSRFVFDTVGMTLKKMTDGLRTLYPDIPVLYAGGVMSNRRIGDILRQNSGVYFARPEFSSDNAAGVALLALRAHAGESKD